MNKINFDNQQLFIHAFEHAGIGMAIVSVNGKIVKVNQSLCDIMGYQESEFLQLSVDDIVPSDDAEIDEYIVQLLTEGKKSSFEIERRYIHKNQYYIWTLMSTTLVRDEQGTPLFYISQVQDISDRKYTEEKLRESEERYHRLVEESPDGVIILKGEKCIFINSTGLEILGLQHKEQIIGRSIYDFIVYQDHERFKSRELDKISIGSFEIRFLRSDGMGMNVELKTIPTIYENAPAVHMMMRDITERKKTQELMINSERLKIAGQLAAGIAHEVRNPLTAIKGFFHMMEKDSKQNKLYFDVIQSEIIRMETILNELLLLAKPQETKFAKKNIEAIINHVLTLLETQTKHNKIQIIKRIEPDLPLIDCDENKLKQVFINFFKNAIEAMTQGGMIHTYVSQKTPDWIMIKINDQGTGIPNHLLDRIGEPFFTTKETGTGLGIMICKNIIEEHKGSIVIESSANGTNIEILLPISK
ncbi:PAS domain S-box protein [Bacillus sp. S/N-304-OC-R1]|uniref:PAS domain S-box protein n=1 Tax=Bacillus sp. S/N-304-OC-R1 TaxID=2758034 RepID=UPI001C8F162B|nr:PAS domain S-box protein [Bacillus sp. S/N-304-OC-R1]MBY0123375.1 PAS domain S-box protein [Bacillus sp. S/N-304-OC-R1]